MRPCMKRQLLLTSAAVALTLGLSPVSAQVHRDRDVNRDQAVPQAQQQDQKSTRSERNSKNDRAAEFGQQEGRRQQQPLGVGQEQNQRHHRRSAPRFRPGGRQGAAIGRKV